MHALLVFCLPLRYDFLQPLPDIVQRIQKWRETAVAKSTKAAEAALLKAIKKSNASVSTPESAAQLQEVMKTAEENAVAYFDTLNIPLARLGSVSETTTARGKLMMAALGQSTGSGSASSDDVAVRLGFCAAQKIQEREGLLTVKKKGGKKEQDKNSAKQSLLSLGKHLLK